MYSSLEGSSGSGLIQYSTTGIINVQNKQTLFLSQFHSEHMMKQEASLIRFYKIVNGLAEVPFEGVLIEANKGTRRKHNKKWRQIWSSTSQYGHSFSPKTISISA